MKLKREGATEFRECADEVEDGESDMKIVPIHIIRVEKHGWELWVEMTGVLLRGRPSRE